MILKAAEKYSINLSNSILVGDNITDAEAGKKAGVRTNIIYNNDITSKHNFLSAAKIEEVIDYL